MIALTIEQIEEADNECSGYCVSCGNNQSGVEPDAEKYTCEVCGKRTVMGSMNLLMDSRVTVVEGDEDE